MRSPDGRRGAWLRFVARGGQPAEVWCITQNGSERAVARWTGAGVDGDWHGEDPQASFALQLAEAAAPDSLLPERWRKALWPQHKLSSPVPHALANGTIRSSLGAWSIENWAASAGALQGPAWPAHYGWAEGSLASGEFFEIVSLPLRAGPLSFSPVTLALFHDGETTHRFERVFQPRIHKSRDGLTWLCENAAGEWFGKVFARDLIALNDEQPNQHLAPLHVAINADVEWRWVPRGGAAQERTGEGQASLILGE